MSRVMLTTFDNPYNPFQDFEKWFAYDSRKGYNTLSYLDRLCPFDPDEPESFADSSYENAMNSIIRFEPQTYHKVYGE